MEFYTYIRFLLDAGQKYAVKCVSQSYSWMTCVIEDLQIRLKCVPWGGRKRHVLKPRLHVLLSVFTANLQVECLTSLHRMSYNESNFAYSCSRNCKCTMQPVRWMCYNKLYLVHCGRIISPFLAILHLHNTRRGLRSSFRYISVVQWTCKYAIVAADNGTALCLIWMAHLMPLLVMMILVRINLADWAAIHVTLC